MTFQNSSRAFVCFLFLFAKVAPWTIDLAEVTGQLFEDDKLKKDTKNENNNYINDSREFYNKIQEDSMAYEFEHQSNLDKKVSDIVQDGGTYLEGLRRALEDYSKFLEECKKQNKSMLQNSSSTEDSVTTSQSNMTIKLNLTNSQNVNISDQLMMTGGNDSNGVRVAMSCREATEVSEKVRRYADLAMWATRKLQELAYAGTFQQSDQYEENELVLKLAWFLDQLAILTGYEQKYKQYLAHRASTSSTPSPQLNDSAVPPSQIDSRNQQSMELLIAADDYRTPQRLTKRSPAHEEYLLPISVHEHHEKPKPVVDFIVKKLSNLKAIVKSVKKHALEDFTSQLAYHKHLHKREINDTSALVNQVSSSLTDKLIQSDESNDPQNKFAIDDKSDKPVTKSDDVVLKSDEPVVNKDILSFKQFPVLDASVVNTKSFKKRSIRDSTKSYILLNRLTYQNAPVKPVKKRSVDDPLSKLTNYYLKYKVWDSSNPAVDNKKNPTNFEVNNNLQSKFISKRAVIDEKNINYKFPRHLGILNSNKYKESEKNGKTKLLIYYINKLEKTLKKLPKNIHTKIKN